ncbi:MAG TPA: type II CAAX endopeptidase family protein [Bryobacteraceae bacterium]|nr:type II CAAX endopeptidase family protein [Bryobacteraceae bacterium]
MPNSPGHGKRAGGAGILAAVWLVLAIAAWVYARMRSLPAWAAVPVAAAFLIEIPFYLSPGSAAVREWLAGLGKVRAASILTAAALLPWLVCSIATAEARVDAVVLLLLVAVVVSFWYILLPVGPATDLLFLAAAAGIYLSKVFDRIYLSPFHGLSITVLGHLMLIRTAALAVLTLRGDAKAEYRFLPKRDEWITGIRYFAMMFPLIAAVYWALGLVSMRKLPANAGLLVLSIIGTFLGMLWVLALSEEFFFRGLLQQWIERWTGKPWLALILASVIFGCAHLGFAHRFPNWRWVILATILGIFCGLAWRKSRSVQAAMVTHALLVTVWRVFLR